MAHFLNQRFQRGTGISVRCEELLKGNGISGGTARVSWCERELLIGQNHILFYFIFSCLFKIQNNYYQRSHSWVLECNIVEIWWDVMLMDERTDARTEHEDRARILEAEFAISNRLEFGISNRAS